MCLATTATEELLSGEEFAALRTGDRRHRELAFLLGSRHGCWEKFLGLPGWLRLLFTLLGGSRLVRRGSRFCRLGEGKGDWRKRRRFGGICLRVCRLLTQVCSHLF